MAFIESAVIIAELARLSAVFGGAPLSSHIDKSLADLSTRNTITLSAPPQSDELSPNLQSGIVDCPWINPFPEGARPLDGADTPPHVTCELFQDPSGGLPTLRVYVSNWPKDVSGEDKSAMVAFAPKGGDTVIVIAHPESANVNLQTICGLGPLNQWFLRGMTGWIWESDEYFIDSGEASSACFDGVQRTSTISITDDYGQVRQFLFDPTNSGDNGNQGAFQPFKPNKYDTKKIYFIPNDEASARTLSNMQNAIEEQLRISTGKEIVLFPSMSMADFSKIIEKIPMPTPTIAPTQEIVATEIPPYIEPPAIIVTAIEQALPEIINYPNANIGMELISAGGNVSIYRENPLATERAGLDNYINTLNTTVDQKAINAQYANIEDVNTWEWIKSWWGGYEYAFPKVENTPINLARVLHINFGEQGARSLIIDGLDINGKLVRLVIPTKGNITKDAGNILTFKNGTQLRFTALDVNGAPDEANETLARLTDQIANYYDMGSKTKTIPEVVVVPMEAVPVLYRDARSRNEITFAAQSLRTKYPTVNVTLAYYDATGAQQIVPDFKLPTGMLGRAKQFLTFYGAPVYEVDIALVGDNVNGNTIDQGVLAAVKAQFPSNMIYNDSFTVYVQADNIAAVPSDKFNPAEPTPGPATATPLPPTTTPGPSQSFTPTGTLAPTQTPIPYELRFPQGEEIHKMDPRLFMTPESYYAPPSRKSVVSHEDKNYAWGIYQSKKSRGLKSLHRSLS